MTRRLLRTALLFALLLLSPLAARAAQKKTFDAYSRVIEVPGVGPVQYYAQNDPDFAGMFYEPRDSQRRRRFEGSACGPTVAAMAIARQVEADGLPELNAHARDVLKGFPFCSCSVNTYLCDDAYRRRKGIADPDHIALTPVTPEEFTRWLPVICASYALGNNDHYLQLRFEEENGTKIELFSALARSYGLAYTGTRDWDVALNALRWGASVITTVTLGVFSNSSHYLFLAGADDAYLYIMDPEMRDEYGKNRKGYLEILEPGLVRVRLENVPNIDLYSFYILEQPQEEGAHDDTP